MSSDTAKAKQAVQDYVEAHSQATTADLNEAVRAVLGDSYTEGKAAGAIRQCVEDEQSGVYRLDRGVYSYQPPQEIRRTEQAGASQPAAGSFAQKAHIDRVMREALQLAKGHIAEQLDLYTLDAQALAYASQKLILLNQALADC